MPLNCSDIHSRLTALKVLKAQFDSAYALALSSKEPTDLNRAKDLKKHLIEDMQSLRDILPVVHVESAKEILGKEVFGKEAVLTTFGIELEEADIPPIPFTAKELERAKDMGQMLILRIDKTNDDKPLSLEIMSSIMEKRWNEKRQESLLVHAEEWKSIVGANAFMNTTPRSGWALVSKDILPNSTNKNYIEQTEIIIKALKESSFKDMELPKEYTEAIAEFELQKEELMRLKGRDSVVRVSRQLSKLKINQLTRQSVQEVIYDLAVYFSVYDEHLLPHVYTWSNSLSSSEAFVYLGIFDVNGVISHHRNPYIAYNRLGVFLSRKASL